jgi:SAM-dependent methyltransferase
MQLSTDLHQRFTEQAVWTIEARKLFLQSAGLNKNSRILEAGCGTGAILESFQNLLESRIFGIDIDPEMVQFAQKQVSDPFLACADAGQMPFPTNHFDAVICHFLLLWVNSPDLIFKEFMRITRPGGVIGILAEPDYGSRIDYPHALEKAGELQRDSLLRKGAHPDIGRQIGELFGKSGCVNISTGIMGSFQKNTSPNNMESEQSVLKSDLGDLLDPENITDLIDLDNIARQNHSRVHFIPTFFGWGYRPLG